jgi:hypothetical protein
MLGEPKVDTASTVNMTLGDRSRREGVSSFLADLCV